MRSKQGPRVDGDSFSGGGHRAFQSEEIEGPERRWRKICRTTDAEGLRAGSTTSAGGSMITKLPERRRPLILVDFVPSFCGRFQPLGISAFHWMTNLLLRQHWQRALACGNCSKSLRDPSGGYRRLLDLGCLGRWAV